LSAGVDARIRRLTLDTGRDIGRECGVRATDEGRSVESRLVGGSRRQTERGDAEAEQGEDGEHDDDGDGIWSREVWSSSPPP
jgi:hypothetical protein